MRVSPKSHAFRVRRNSFYLETSKKKVQITDKFLDGVFLGIRECSKDFVCWNTCWLCGVKILSFSTASVQRAGDWCQVTNHANPESQESNRCELMYVLRKLIFLLQPTRNQPSHVECTELAIHIGREAAMTQDLRVTTRHIVGHESPKP